MSTCDAKDLTPSSYTMHKYTPTKYLARVVSLVEKLEVYLISQDPSIDILEVQVQPFSRFNSSRGQTGGVFIALLI